MAAGLFQPAILSSLSSSFRRGRDDGHLNDQDWLLGDDGVNLPPLLRSTGRNEQNSLLHAQDITTQVLDEIDCDLFDEVDEDATNVAHMSHSSPSGDLGHNYYPHQELLQTHQEPLVQYAEF
jgi:hypothetical protein